MHHCLSSVDNEIPRPSGTAAHGDCSVRLIDGHKSHPLPLVFETQMAGVVSEGVCLPLAH